MRTITCIEWRKKLEDCEYANVALDWLEKFLSQVTGDINQKLNPSNQVTADTIEVFNAFAFKIAPKSIQSEYWYVNHENVNTVFLGSDIRTTTGIYTGLAMVMQHKVLWDAVKFLNTLCVVKED